MTVIVTSLSAGFFGFLKPHIRHHKKDTPASGSISLKLNSTEFVKNFQFPKLLFPDITFKYTYVCFLFLSLQFKDKLALVETGELAGSDDSTMIDSFADQLREPTKIYTGYPTPRPSSRTRTATEDRPVYPTMDMRVTGASSDRQDILVQFITREQQVNRATPFCKYLETELDRLHDACQEPEYEITTVLNQ